MHPEDEDYYVVPVIPYEEEGHMEHNASGFCGDMSHECPENPESITDLQQAVQDGEATPEDANRIYRGQTV